MNAKALQEQLGQLLALPLAPKMSGRYFTGGAAAAVAHGAGLKATSGPAPPDSAQAAVPSETVDKVRDVGVNLSNFVLGFAWI